VADTKSVSALQRQSRQGLLSPLAARQTLPAAYAYPICSPDVDAPRILFSRYHERSSIPLDDLVCLCVHSNFKIGKTRLHFTRMTMADGKNRPLDAFSPPKALTAIRTLNYSGC
jgi:hypothetical protein